MKGEKAITKTQEEIKCPICGKTFKDRRGLNGHMAGLHGSKWGLNATVDTLAKEVAGVKQEMAGIKQELARGIRAVNQDDIVGLKQEITEVKQGIAGIKRELEFVGTRMDRWMDRWGEWLGQEFKEPWQLG